MLHIRVTLSLGIRNVDILQQLRRPRPVPHNITEPIFNFLRKYLVNSSQKQNEMRGDEIDETGASNDEKEGNPVVYEATWQPVILHPKTNNIP